MKRSFLMIFLVLVLFCMSFAAGYVPKETEVSFYSNGQLVKGILTELEEMNSLSPAVVIFHGFTGQKNEMDVTGTEEAMFEMTARQFAENGIASLRIDFIGSGESEGRWEDTTFSSQIDDAMAAITYLQSLPQINPERIAVLGLSQGGLVAACTASRDSRVKTAVLWSPVAVPAYTYGNLLGADVVTQSLELEGDDMLEATLPWGSTTLLKKPFYQELFLTDPVAEIAKYNGPLMVTVGLKDTVVTPQPQAGMLFTKYHDGLEKLVQLDADHMLGIFEGPENLQIAIDEALEWFEATL
ncbi:MAG TPA: alpha/beta fold hydrolase [Thermotogota bacterium]|nr:alpha/beta fold hydrolase [Thermotogota bacterium]HPJ87739.1 alpha/beta fold hydrolase [Thermotogota bacterium]HPR96929.1 alpha/beta fold hydrolase [Thermotogota bacterium]